MTTLQKAIHVSLAVFYGVATVAGVFTIGFVIVPGFAGVSPLSTDLSHHNLMVHATFAVYFMILGMNLYPVWLKGKHDFDSFLLKQGVFWAVVPLVLWIFVSDLPTQVTLLGMVLSVSILKYLTITD